jgi:hypothetical protein
VSQCHILFPVFFHESSSPKALETTLELFRIFSKICGDTRKSRCTTGLNDTGVNDTNEKCSASVNYSTQFNETGSKFSHRTAGVVDSGGKFATGINDTAVNFYTGTTGGVVNTRGKFATGINETDSKFATGVNNIGGK